MEEPLFEKMENYLNGQLNTEERRAFEAELAVNEVLHAEFEAHKKLVNAIETEGLRQLLDQLHLQHFHTEKDSTTEKGKTVAFRPLRPWMTVAAAASVLLVLALGWWWQRPVSQQALYSAYFSPASGLPTTLGMSDNPRFAEGMVSYKLGEFEAAIRNWQPLLAEQPSNDTLQFYQGMARLALGETEAALEILQPLSELSAESTWQEQATWYTALALLKLEQAEKARPLLQRLADGSGSFAERSRQLLEEL